MMGKESSASAKRLQRAGILSGFIALVWFLVRVIPKPSRASYPCQRAAFRLANAFVVWLCGTAAGTVSMVPLRRFVHCYRYTAASIAIAVVVAAGIWIARSREIEAAEVAAHYDYAPKTYLIPLGQGRGISPGRVV